MKHLKIIALLLLPALVGFDCWGQDVIITPKGQLSEVDEDNEIVYEQHFILSPNGKHRIPSQLVKAVHFISRSSGDTCRSILLSNGANSPYNRLEYPLSEERINYPHIPEGYKVYDISAENPNRIIGRFFPDTEGDVKKLVCFKQLGSYPVSLHKVGESHNTNGNFLALAYVLAGKIDNERCSTGGMGGSTYRDVLYQTSVVVYNNKGEVIAKIISEGTNCHRAVITHDGRYVALTYGDMLEDFVNVGDGYRIYDLKERKLLVDKQVVSMNGCSVVNRTRINCSSVNHAFVPNSTEQTIYDTEKRMSYTYVFKGDLRNKPKQIRKDGVAVYTNVSKENFEYPSKWDSVYLYLEKDFEQTKF